MISIVAPVFDEEDVLQEFYERVTKVMAGVGEPYEFVFVDDGSRDGSFKLLRDFATNDGNVRVVSLSRNFGHQLAITAGLDRAQGDAVIVIDADLQDPPEVIPAMLEQWRAGIKVVYGVRTARAGESRSKLTTARWFYRMLGKLSDTPVPSDAGDFRLLDRQVVDTLGTMREDSRYLRGMVSWVGFRQAAVGYERDARRAGTTKFTLRKMLRFATDGVTSFSDRPLKLATQLGVLITLSSFVYAAWVLISAALDPNRAFRGYPTLLAAVLFLGGVQLLSIGILGTYVARIYRESKRRPLYVVAEEIGAPPR